MRHGRNCDKGQPKYRTAMYYTHTYESPKRATQLEAHAPEPRTEGAEGPNASVEGRVEALAPEESDTKPSTWHRGSTGKPSTTCHSDVMAP